MTIETRLAEIRARVDAAREHPVAHAIVAEVATPTLLAAVEAVDRLIRPWEVSEVEAHRPGAGFHAALQFAAHHVRYALAAALEVEG